MKSEAECDGKTCLPCVRNRDLEFLKVFRRYVLHSYVMTSSEMLYFDTKIRPLNPRPVGKWRPHREDHLIYVADPKWFRCRRSRSWLLERQFGYFIQKKYTLVSRNKLCERFFLEFSGDQHILFCIKWPN